MESKSKTFAHKLLALFLAVVMALTCFTGALTAFAADYQDDVKEYHDTNLASNFMTWAETTDEQTAEALLDYADLYLEDLMTGLLGSSRIYFSQDVVVATITIDAHLDSVDGLIDLVAQLQSLLNSYGSLIGGDVKNINLTPLSGLSYVTSGTSATGAPLVVSACGKSYRGVNSAKEIIMALAKTLYINSNDFAGKNVIGQFVKGKMSLGSLVEGIIGGDIYSLLQGTLNMWDGYESNLVYNIVANLIWENTDWYTDEEIAGFKADLTTWDFDTELFGKLSSELLNKISVLVTYPEKVNVTNSKGEVTTINDNSGLRRERIEEYMQKYGVDFATASTALGYDPNLRYSTEEGMENNILLLQYGDKKVNVNKNDTLFSVAFKALEIAWETVLEPTLGLLHVNYNVDRGNGANFDNEFFYWMTAEKTWNTSDWKANYSAANVEEWANAVYDDYNCQNADEFLANVKHTFEFDRTIAEDQQKNWRDIDPTTLFAKLRYNPLADLYFDMQTGPLNLYFEQTGISNLSSFFDTVFTDYSDMVAGFNDALVAATKDLFPESDNIGLGDGENNVTTDLIVPTMATTGNTSDNSTIATTLVTNAVSMFEYAANATDENILGPYYANHNITTYIGNLSEANFEEAMIPFLIACLQQLSITEPIHDEKWDACVDAEGVAYVALEEYLSYVLPDKDYSQLISYNTEGKIVAGKVDISGDGNYTLFEDAILPMARDAVGYLLSSIVPCRTKDGVEWDVYKTNVTTDKTTIFEILNSVICYYASADTFTDAAGKNGKTYGRAIATLLGVVNESGECLIKNTNTLWENLDLITNKLFPIVGALQYGSDAYKGKANSEDLVYNNFIKGFLDIGVKVDGSYGMTNVIKKLLTVVTADPIANKGIDLMVYDDLLVPFANALFGARYTGQGYTYVIPYSSYYDTDSSSNTKSESPFNSLVHVDTLGYYSVANGANDGKETGVLGILICNIYEFFGGNAGTYDTSAKAGADGCWDGAMFAVTAVNNFIPSFVPQLSNHSLNMASAEVDNASQSSLTAGTTVTTSLKIRNNSTGLNRFWRDANGNVNRDGRYFMQINYIDITDLDGNIATGVTLGSYQKVVAPEDITAPTVSAKVQSGSNLYTFTVNYDLFEGELSSTGALPSETSDNVLYEGLETKAYFYLSTEKSWKDTTYYRQYSDDTSIYMIGDTEPALGESNEYAFSTTNGGSGGSLTWKNGYLHATFPNNLVIQTSDPHAIENYGVRVYNNRISGSNSTDGLYTYLRSGTSYYAVSGGTVASSLTTATGDNINMAYAAINRENGDVLNYNLYDYTTDGKTWNRGTKNTDSSQLNGGYEGYTADEINALPDSTKNSGSFMTRPHVVWTIDEAIASGFVTGVQRTEAAPDAAGNKTYTYDAVFVTPNTTLLQGTAVNSGKYSISWGTPTPGIYLTAYQVSVSGGKSVYFRWIAYDGTTPLSADEYDMAIDVYTTNNHNMRGTIHMVIADDSQNSALGNAYNKDLKEMTSYRAQDFNTTTVNGEEVNVYEEVQTALGNALATVSTPVNETNGSKLGSTMMTQAKTYETTSEYGDPAYKPVPSSQALPGAIQVYATKGTDYWYWNEEMTLPIYSSERLTDADVVSSKDKAGQPVIKGEDGTWYVRNAVKYETEWDTSTYEKPYLATTTTPATTSNGDTIYKVTQFVYRDSQGNKVTSKDDWAYKFAESESVIKPNDGNEYRGIYQQAIDELDFWMQTAKSSIKSGIAGRIAEQVSADRQGQNNVNYNVASYEKMVLVARSAENLITSKVAVDEYGDPLLDEDGNQVYEYSTENSSLQIDEAIRMYNIFKDRVIDRNYIGDKLEAEIICASDYSYDELAQTSATVDNVTTYTVTGTANQPAEYGAYNASGVLVNEGDIVYTDDSWTAYVNALGAAIEVAQKGNADATDPDAVLSKVYSAKTALQIAENNLVDASADGISISGTVMIATEPTGTEYSSGIGGIKIMAGDEIIGETAADGTFSVVVPAGTTEIVFTGDTTIDRTVSVNGAVADAIVPIVICDYNKDGKVNSYDKLTFNSSYNNTAAYNLYCDLNADGKVNSYDKLIFNTFYNVTVAYDALVLG